MDEAHFSEVEKTLLFVSEARKRAEKAVKQLRSSGAAPYLIAAVEDAERELDSVARRLTQETYFAVPKEQRSSDPVEELTLT